MSSIIQEAKLANGRSQRCEMCPFKGGRCTHELHHVCSDNFIEGFIKGAKFMRKKKKEKSYE